MVKNHIPINLDPESPEASFSLCGLISIDSVLVSFSNIDPTCQQCLDIQNKVITEAVCELCNTPAVKGEMIEWEDHLVHKDCYWKITQATEEKEKERLDSIFITAQNKG